MSWTRIAALSVIAVAGLAVGRPAAAGPLVYDAFTDYSTTSNPTAGSVWSYGYEPSLGGAFTPFAWTGVVSTLNMWARNSTTINPDVDKNTTGVDYVPTGTPFVGIIFPGTEYIHMHPGQNGEYGVLRWTAPVSGTYNLVARFRSLRNSNAGASTDVHMLKNGVQFAGGSVTGFYSAGDLVTSTAPQTMSAGDTLDFAVGYGTGGYSSDSTGLALTITLAAPAVPPSAPTNLQATYTDQDGVSLTWTDTSANETGFRVERSPSGYPFALLTNTAADVTTASDQVLYPSTTYVYRVRSFNATGDSAWSNEASIITSAAVPVPAAPNAPSQLSAQAQPDGSILLAWSDNSADELRFEVERVVGGGAFARVVAVPSNVTGFSDYDLHPGWISTYRVRALSLQGPSAYSNNAAAVLPGTIDVVMVSGGLTDSPKAKKDKLKLSASYALSASAHVGAKLEPLVSGLELQLGSANAPILLSVPPGEASWKVKTKKGTPSTATWKSAKGALPKVTLVVDLVRHVITATVSGADFSKAPSTSARALVACGADGGAHIATWTQRKPGVLVLE